MRYRYGIFLLVLMFLGGCSLPKSPPSEFYVLVGEDKGQNQGQIEEGVRIGIVPISMPNYLLRPQMVLRSPGNPQVVLDEFHRWAEDLPTAFQRVLSLSLGNNLSQTMVMPLRMGFIVDYRLTVDVRAFEGDLNSAASLDAFWTLQKDSKILAEGHFVQSLPTGDTYDTLVKAQSNLVSLLGENIALTVKQLGIKDFPLL